jgi:uncharacterized repeat protein (TIGR03803 family)
MRSRGFSIGSITLWVLFSVSLSAAQTETILHSFNNTDGNSPSAGVVFDASGNLYGTTFYGGPLGDGTVYELSPNGSGWTETVLQNFNGFGGNWPTASLVLDSAGNLYGTTFFGGALGYGIAYELARSSGGDWTEVGLHGFSKFDKDATYPRSALVFDAAGNLYGTAPDGGAAGYGAVFQLTPSAGGGWSETLIHSFNNTAGGNPYGSLVLDAAGNLYGTASVGGGSSSVCHFGCGTVFELSPTQDGSWTMKVLHNFTKNSTDGNGPIAGLIIDSAGNLYGTTPQGGKYGFGIAFELTPVTGGWKETILHNFASNGVDGNSPSGPLARDSAGNLYGTTASGGADDYGTVYKLVRTAHDWKETILHSFNSTGADGSQPFSGIVLDSFGNLYGTTESGGSYGYGTVFEVTP